MILHFRADTCRQPSGQEYVPVFIQHILSLVLALVWSGLIFHALVSVSVLSLLLIIQDTLYSWFRATLVPDGTQDSKKEETDHDKDAELELELVAKARVNWQSSEYIFSEGQ